MQHHNWVWSRLFTNRSIRIATAAQLLDSMPQEAGSERVTSADEERAPLALLPCFRSTPNYRPVPGAPANFRLCANSGLTHRNKLMLRNGGLRDRVRAGTSRIVPAAFRHWEPAMQHRPTRGLICGRF